VVGDVYGRGNCERRWIRESLASYAAEGRDGQVGVVDPWAPCAAARWVVGGSWEAEDAERRPVLGCAS
jgi:hypothetical protein